MRRDATQPESNETQMEEEVLKCKLLAFTPFTFLFLLSSNSREMSRIKKVEKKFFTFSF